MKPMEKQESVGPLAGVAVVETPGEVATRYCGRLFAQLGARVWRVTDSAPIDPLFAAWLDEGKQSASSLEAALEAMDGAGPDRRLVIAGQNRARVADVEAQLAARPDAPPLLALTWFDPRGPYAERNANDPIIQAMTGVAFSFGPIEGPPTLAQGHAPQTVAGITAFIAALAALLPEQPTVRRIEANVFEANLCFMETGSVAAAALGLESHRLGVNRFVPTCPSGLFRSSDGFIGVTALTPAQWRALANLIGRPDMAAEPRYASSIERLMAADELDAVLIPAFLEHPTAYWVERGDSLRIPITPATPPRQLPHDPHWSGRAAFARFDDGQVQGPTLPYRFTFDGERAPRPRGRGTAPLEGLRVADFSMGWAGPLGARYLGDLGADVLKVESTAKPDWWRGWEVVPMADPPPTELPRNFMAVNRAKRGLDLDLASPAGRRAAEAIIARSDVVLDNQGPGVMEKLGLGPKDQRRLNPAAVSISMPPFGRAGPLSGLRAYGSTVEQASGMPFVNGRDDWDPCQQHVAFGDPVAGLYAAAAALTGLYARTRLGAADIDLCQVECLFQLGAQAIIAEQALGAPLPRTGSRRAAMAPCCVVRGAGDAEAWLAAAVDSDEAWLGLCRALGRPDLAADADLATLAGRKAREDELEALLDDWAATRAPADAAEALQAEGVAAAALVGAHVLCFDPHLVACDYWAVQHRRYVGAHITPRPPFRYDGERPAFHRPAPVLGEHTAEVLAELGIVSAEPA